MNIWLKVCTICIGIADDSSTVVENCARIGIFFMPFLKINWTHIYVFISGLSNLLKY